MSCLVTRPFMPLPLTCAMGTPSSRAKRRIAGLAWALPAAALIFSLIAGAVGAAFAGGRAVLPFWEAGGCGLGEAVASWIAGLSAAGAIVAPVLSNNRIKVSFDTLSPTLTLISLTTPAYGAGTSIAALSVSRVNKLSSALTVSPTLTISSMMLTSL